MKRLLSCLMCLSFILPVGCNAVLSGAGNVGMGYSSESRIFLFHDVDGDKEDKKAESKLDLDALMDLIVKYKAGLPDESTD